ncbi:MAG: HIRAN domain-containing protein [Enterocloster sp.]
MNKLTQEAPQSFRGRMYQRDNARPKEQRILVLKTGIAGLQFHIENEEEQAALNAITPGTELMLFREPDNEYDEWAIAVHLTAEDKLGFISRFKNETIARLMDAGKKFIGVVDDPEADAVARDIAEKELRRSRHAPTENMALPFSVYLIEEA